MWEIKLLCEKPTSGPLKMLIKPKEGVKFVDTYTLIDHYNTHIIVVSLMDIRSIDFSSQ